MDDHLVALAGIVPDKASHIYLKNNRVCRNRCPVKPCTIICPTLVFRWDEAGEIINIQYSRCVECGACAPACPRRNIELNYPRGGFGKVLHI